MKIISCRKPGTLENLEIPMPDKKTGEAILKVRRIGICGTDLHAFEGTQPFFNYPRVLGHELALEVVEAEGFTKGEAVTLLPYFNCGTCIACRNGLPNCCVAIEVFGVHIDGGMKEFISVPLAAVIPGEGLSLDELALVEPLAIGAHGIQRAGVKKEEYVLVMGAGPIGLGIMEMGRIAGAKIIALDVNAQRLAFCGDHLSVMHCINGATENVEERLLEITNGDMPTVVMDATGNLKAMEAAFQYMAHGARYVLVGLQKEALHFSHPSFHKKEATLMSSRNATKSDFRMVMQAMKNKKIEPSHYITHRIAFDLLAAEFPSLLDPANGVIKAMVYLD